MQQDSVNWTQYPFLAFSDFRTGFAISQLARKSHPQSVKFLIILAAVLLIPIVLKFQQKSFLQRSVPKTTASITKLLKEEGVQNASVDLQYLDARIGGLVETEEQARAIGKKVASLRGVRLLENEIVTRGSLEVKRQNGILSATGAIPANWRKEVFKKQAQVDTSGLKFSDTITMPAIRAVSLGLVVDGFFAGEGDRSLQIQGSLVSVRGEAIPAEAPRLKRLLSSLGAGVKLDSQMTLYPSSYHYDSRAILSPIEGESLRSLSQQLADKTIGFGAGESSLTPQSREKLEEISALIQEAKSGVKFVLGCHPDTKGEELARKRAQAAYQYLQDTGMRKSRVEVVGFEMTEEESEFLGQVELLVR